VLWIVGVIEAARVVEPGEELDDEGVCAIAACELEADGADSPPVRGAMDALPVESELRADMLSDPK
jgi:hypothetical protein